MPHVAWSKGGEADLTALEGERVRLRSTVSSAPGSRIEGTLGTGTLIRVKVARCRQDAGAFEIEGRLLDATRSVRGELAALLGQGARDAG
jgi:hypothetical protein